MLNKIVETKKEELKSLQLPPEAEVIPTSFFNGLKNRQFDIGLIAEVKKASPSKGVIKEDFNPVEIAMAYERGGANAISVLTDSDYFQGSKEYLTSIKRNVKLPVLRKDFIIDHAQIKESKLIGADAILLIAEILEPSQLLEFYLHGEEVGMDLLVEVHSEQSLDGILSLFIPKLIGVNNRDLTTFKTSIEQTKKLSKMIPEDSLFISESGIYTPDDLEFVKEAGAAAVLVGESLMKEPSQEEAVRQLFRKYVM